MRIYLGMGSWRLLLVRMHEAGGRCNVGAAHWTQALMVAQGLYLKYQCPGISQGSSGISSIGIGEFIIISLQ